MAALLFRQLHGLNTLHTFLQCIRTIHFGSVKVAAGPSQGDGVSLLRTLCLHSQC